MKDLIERQVLLDIVSGYKEPLESYIGSPDDSETYAYARGLLLSIEKNLNALQPSASTEKTGYWILLDECSNSGYYCSECHKKVVKEGWSETVKKIKFCPNCGIKILPQPCKEESEV